MLSNDEPVYELIEMVAQHVASGSCVSVCKSMSWTLLGVGW